MLTVKNNLQAWYQSTQVSGNLSLTDLSGHGRTITQVTTPPVVQANVQNGKQSIYFNGSKNPLTYVGSLPVRHVFIIASYEDATFGANHRGLLSDVNTNAYLLGETSLSKFTDLSFGAFGYSYKKAGITYADNNQLAPMNNQLAIIEFSFATSAATFDGIKIGQDRNDPTRRWKGHFLEALFYSEVQDEFAVHEIYKHFGEEWHLWREKTAGIPIFPFPADHTRQVTPEQKVFLSQPYDGDPVALVRGTAKKSIDFTFSSRRADEYLAADEFNRQLFPLGKFIYRDYTFYPPIDMTLRFTSNVKEQGSLILKSYAFTAKEP